MNSGEKKTLVTIRSILSVMLVILTLLVFKSTRSISINFVLSLFVFLLFLPLCITLEKAKMPAAVATFIAAVLMILVVVAFVYFAIFSADNIISVLPTYSSKLENLDQLLSSIVGRWVDLPDNFSAFTYIQIDWMNGVFIPAVRTISSSAIVIFKDCFFTILLSIFLLAERNTIVPKIIEMSKTDNREKVSMLFDRIYKQVAKYISLKLIVSVATGILFFAICKFVGQDFAAIIGVLAVILNFIPTFGSIAITVCTIFLAVLQFAPDWTSILIVVAGTISVQMVIGNIIDPRLQGSQLNLSTFVILCSMSLFGYIWGIVGTFLAVPILSVTVIILANIEETKGLAVLLSSGHANLKKSRENKKNKKDGAESKYGDVVF